MSVNFRVNFRINLRVDFSVDFEIDDKVNQDFFLKKNLTERNGFSKSPGRETLGPKI